MPLATGEVFGVKLTTVSPVEAYSVGSSELKSLPIEESVDARHIGIYEFLRWGQRLNLLLEAGEVRCEDAMQSRELRMIASRVRDLSRDLPDLAHRQQPVLLQW